jgi:hypothetical protein
MLRSADFDTSDDAESSPPFQSQPLRNRRAFRSSNFPPQRKRISSNRFSTDTTTSVTTLPEYSTSSSPPSSAKTPLSSIWDNDDGNPPDYTAPLVSHIPTPLALKNYRGDVDAEDEDVRPPSRPRRRIVHHKSYSNASSDPFLDSLLERSVKALEISNALLQSSANTKSGLSALLEDSPIADNSLEFQARNLSRRIQATRAQEARADEVFRGVDRFIDDTEGISRSVPTDHEQHMRVHRQQSYLSRQASGSGHLPFLRESREFDLNFLQPYMDDVESGVDSLSEVSEGQVVLVPNTPDPRYRYESDDLRSPAPSSTSSYGLYNPALPAILTNHASEPSTPAYNLLSSIVRSSARSGSPSGTVKRMYSANTLTSPTPHQQSFIPKIRRGTESDDPGLGRGRGRGRGRGKTRDFSSQSVRTSLLAPLPSIPIPTSSSFNSQTWPTEPGHRRKRSHSAAPSIQTPRPSMRPPTPLMSSSSMTARLSSTSEKGVEKDVQTRGHKDVVAFRTVESLKKILQQESEARTFLPPETPAPSSKAAGKQRAPDERPSQSTPTKKTFYTLSASHRSDFSPPTLERLPVLSALTLPDPPEPSTSASASSSMPSPKISHNLTPIRPSSLKRPSSNRSSPYSSGRSSPKVSFSELPPKYHAERSRGRTLRRENAKPDETAAGGSGWLWGWGWLSGLGASTGDGAVRRAREEGGGGRPVYGPASLEEWQR